MHEYEMIAVRGLVVLEKKLNTPMPVIEQGVYFLGRSLYKDQNQEPVRSFNRTFPQNAISIEQLPDVGRIVSIELPETLNLLAFSDRQREPANIGING